jgi:hypothetical protein
MTTRTARRPRRPARNTDPEPEQGYEPDPEENGDERPSRRSASRPSRRAAPSRRGGADEDEPRRGRRGRGSRDDAGEAEEAAEGVDVQGGWGTWRQRRAETSGFADDFKVEYKEKYLIMFLDDAPFAAFNEHWIDEMPKGKKKSYVCIGKKAGCPLCVALGEQPSARALFNILEFIDTDDGREAVHKVWTCGSGVVQEIEENSEDVGLEGNYFKVSKSKSGKNGPTTYSVQHQKERDVEEPPWDMTPLTDDEIDEWMEKKFDKSYVKIPSKKALQDVADEVLALD